MDKNKLLLRIQTIICILVVLILSMAAIGVYRDGKARKAEDPGAYIYTREIASEAFLPGTMLAVFGLGIAAACALIGIKDEKAEKPVKDIPDPAAFDKQVPDEKLKKIRLVLLVLSIIFIIAGIVNGNMGAILIKAINICTECVGLG